MQPQPPSPRREHQHQRVEQLLPWYVNGTLAAAEKRAVEEHLAVCPACRAELAACHELSRAIDDLGEVAPSPHPVQLARLLARIDAGIPSQEVLPDEDAAPASAASQASDCQRPLASPRDAGVIPAGDRRLARRLTALLAATPRPMRTLLAAQLAGIALLGGLLSAVVAGLGGQAAPRRPAPAPVYHTLSEPAPPPTPVAQLRVVFDDAATAAAIHEILAGVRGQIVSGPSQLGTYTVEVPRGRGADPLEVVLQHLQGRREVSFAGQVAGSDGAQR